MMMGILITMMDVIASAKMKYEEMALSSPITEKSVMMEMSLMVMGVTPPVY